MDGSDGEVGAQPTEFGIEWYVILPHIRPFYFVRGTHSGVCEGISAMEKLNAKGKWSG